MDFPKNYYVRYWHTGEKSYKCKNYGAGSTGFRMAREFCESLRKLPEYDYKLLQNESVIFSEKFKKKK